MPILPTSFWMGHSKLKKKQMKSSNLKMTSIWTFSKTLRSQLWRKLQIYRNKKLAIMPLYANFVCWWKCRIQMSQRSMFYCFIENGYVRCIEFVHESFLYFIFLLEYNKQSECVNKMRRKPAVHSTHSGSGHCGHPIRFDPNLLPDV